MIQSSPADSNRSAVSSDHAVLLLRGADRTDLAQQVDSLVRTLVKNHDAASMFDLADSLSQLVGVGGVRLSIVASSQQEFRSRLQRAAIRLADPNCKQIADVQGIYYFSEPLGVHGKVALLFPGEGAQYCGMLSGLDSAFPAVKEIYDVCDRQAATCSHDGQTVSRFTRSRDQWTNSELQQVEQDLLRIDNAMFGVFMANWAMLEVVQQLGIRPHAVAGHSAGELAALVTAGVFDPRTHVGALRGTLQSLVGHDNRGYTLLAVGAPRQALAEVIDAALQQASTIEASVAMDNCPHQSIAVGKAEAIARIEAEATRRGLMCQRLELGRPYHTQWFEPFMEPLQQLFSNIEFQTPSLPVYSCTTGELFPDDPEAIRQLALDHWRRPVEFTRLVGNLYRSGVRVFIEVGPRNNLTSFVDDILRGQPHLAVPSDVRHRSATEQLCHMAALLAAHHVSLNLDALHARHVAQRPSGKSPPLNTNAPKSNEDGDLGLVAAPSQPRSTGSSRASRGRSAVMRRHLATAEQFLQVQTQVMEQYLAHRRDPGNRQLRQRAALGRFVAKRLAAKAPRPSSPRRQPLLGEILQLEPGEKLVARRILDPKEDRYAEHHTVGGRSISKVDPDQHGLPIMPMTFTLEIMLEAAAALYPDLCVLGVENIRLSRWLEFHRDDPASIQIIASRVDAAAKTHFTSATRHVLVEVKDLGRASQQDQDPAKLAAVGTVALGESFPEPPDRDDFRLSNQRDCHTDVATTYNNLFHGELLQGFESVERFGDEGIEGTVRTLPRQELLHSVDSLEFVSDPVLLDVAMHPAVAWHLEQPDQAGRIMLPFELERLELYGPMPAEGKPFVSRTTIVDETHWQYTHSTELLDDAGTLWSRIHRVKLWRFYLPFHDVNFHGPKDVYFLSDEWPDASPIASQRQAGETPCCCVRLRELNDLKQPALQLAAARVMLSPKELNQFVNLRRPEDKKAEWLFGRAAAKDAVRILRRKQCGERPFMADVEILGNDQGQPIAQPRGADRTTDYPHVSISHAGGFIVALAAQAPHVGVDIEEIAPREASFEEIAFDAAERRLLDQFEDRDEWIARFWCAKEAVGKALGHGMLGGPRGLAVRSADLKSGLVEVVLGAQLAELFPELKRTPLLVTTLREDQLAAATTLCEPALESQHDC